MKLNLKDEPMEWRKSALLAALGLALGSSLLRWRHVLTNEKWRAVLAALAAVALVLFFIFILTPAGFILRFADKNPLQLKRPAKAATFWPAARDASPLDRLC